MQDPFADLVPQQRQQQPRVGFIPGTPRPTPPAEQQRLDIAERADERAARADQRAAESHARSMTGGGDEATEGERRAAAFLRNALAAARDYESSGVAPPAPGTALGETVLGYGPMGTLPAPVGYSPEREQAVQRELAFTNAILRAESGANAPEPETARYVRQYFPGPGASEEAQENFRAARRRAVQSLLGMGGRAVDPQLRQEVEGWLAGDPAAGATPPTSAAPSLGGQPPQEVPTTTERPIMPSGPGQMELSDQVQSGTNPALAGLNQRIGQMIQQDRPVGEMVRYLRERGVSGQNLSAIAQELARIGRWRRENNYRGPHDVDLERYEQQLDPIASTVADVADSSVGAAAVAAGDVVTGGHLDNLVGLTGGDSELANAAMGALRQNRPGASLAGDIVGGGTLYGAGRAALGGVLRRTLPTAAGAFSPAAIGGDAAMGAYIGSGSQGTDPLSAEGAVWGGLGGAAGGIAGRGLINTTARAVSPTGGALAPAYAEGVQPTVGQRMGGVFDRAEQAFSSVPLVGGIQRGARNNAVQQWQGGAFNQALREIGQELPRGIRSGTAAHGFMQRAFNRAYSQARSGMTFRPDTDFANDLGAIQQNIAGLSDAAQSEFANLVRSTLGNRLRANRNVLDGNNFIRVQSRIGKRVRALRNNQNADQELADAFEELSVAIDNAASRHSPQQYVDMLAQTNRGYARAVLIEGAGRRAGGGETGEFTGRQLEAELRNNSGIRSRAFLRGEAPMQDYAASGVRLGNSVPDSGTPERILTLGGLAGLAHFVDPVTMLPYAANTAANIPGIRQGVNAALAPNRQQLDPVRQALLNRGYLGSLLLAGPAAEAGAQ